MRALVASLMAIGLACGSAGVPSGCHDSSECGAGLVCIVSSSGQPGSCQPPPIAIAMTAPAAGAKVGLTGATIRARVTLAASDAAPPSAVVLVVDGAEAGTLALESRDGAVLAYAGSYVPRAGLVSNPALFVAARTSAGTIASDGVFVDVDTKPPVLKLVSGPGCGRFAACPRDGAIDLFVAVTEDHPGVVEATVDLDGHALAVPFGPAQIGTDLTVSIPLARYPFPRFSGTVKPRVHARDAFGNEATLDELAAFPVTRLRWAYDSKGLSVTSPAIASDGSAVVGVNAIADQLRGIREDGLEGWRSSIGTKGIVSAPSLGASTVWVGSDDGKLYGRVDADTIFGCPASAAVGSMFTPAVLGGATEKAFSAGAASKLYGGASDRTCTTSTGVSTTDPVTTAPAAAGGKLFVLTTRAARSTVRRYSAELAEEANATTTCGTVVSPPAIDGEGGVVVSCAGGEIIRCDPSTLSTTTLATLADYAQESIVILPGGDLLLGTNDGKLHRLTPPASGSGAWTDLWSSLPAVSASVRGMLVAEKDGDGVVAYAVTADGQLYALDADGRARWSTTGEASSPLGISPLTFPTVAPATSAGQLSTLYVGSEDGHLYAVVVDTGLDASSPWPKSHHDLRNTGNADAPVLP
jgi:outer membrane protein assembly factor BamB